MGDIKSGFKTSELALYGVITAACLYKWLSGSDVDIAAMAQLAGQYAADGQIDTNELVDLAGKVTGKTDQLAIIVPAVLSFAYAAKRTILKMVS